MEGTTQRISLMLTGELVTKMKMHAVETGQSVSELVEALARTHFDMPPGPERLKGYAAIKKKQSGE